MILDRFKLDGKVAIVTGASTGLGQGICYGLSEAGAKIVGVDYVEMDETKATIEANGGEFVGVVANLMTLEPIEGIINTAIEKFGRLIFLLITLVLSDVRMQLIFRKTGMMLLLLTKNSIFLQPSCCKIH